MIKVTFVAGRWVLSYWPEISFELAVPEGTSVRQAALLSGLPEDEIGLFSCNGERLLGDEKLEDGDVVTLFPVIMGG